MRKDFSNYKRPWDLFELGWRKTINDVLDEMNTEFEFPEYLGLNNSEIEELITIFDKEGKK